MSWEQYNSWIHELASSQPRHPLCTPHEYCLNSGDQHCESDRCLQKLTSEFCESVSIHAIWYNLIEALVLSDKRLFDSVAWSLSSFQCYLWCHMICSLFDLRQIFQVSHERFWVCHHGSMLAVRCRSFMNEILFCWNENLWEAYRRNIESHGNPGQTDEYNANFCRGLMKELDSERNG